MNLDTTINQNCWCDPTFAGVSYSVNATDINCEKFTKACWIYDLLTVVSFFILGLYLFISIVFSIFLSYYKNREITRDMILSTRNVVLFLMLLCCVARWIRFLPLLLEQEIIKEKKELLTLLDVLYSIGLGIGLLGYTFLITAWMRFYRDIIRDKPNRKDFCSTKNFIKIYIIINILVLIIYGIAFSIESAIPSTVHHVPSSIWLVFFIIFQTIFLAVYGTRISKTIKEFTAAVPSDLERFRRLHWLTLLATFWFLMSAIVLLVGSLLVYLTRSLPVFIAKHIAYRICELVLIAIIGRSLRPSFRSCCGESEGTLVYTSRTRFSETDLPTNSEMRN